MITAYQQMLLNEAARLRITLTVVEGELVFDFSHFTHYMFARMVQDQPITAAMRNEIEKWWNSKTQS